MGASARAAPARRQPAARLGHLGIYPIPYSRAGLASPVSCRAVAAGRPWSAIGVPSQSAASPAANARVFPAARLEGVEVPDLRPDPVRRGQNWLEWLNQPQTEVEFSA